jgi:hypothetical protein
MVSKVKTLANSVPSPTLCGDIAIVEQDRVPFGWANSVDPNNMPSKLARMVIRC